MMLRILKYYACVRVLLCSVTLCNISFIVTLTGVNYDDCQLRCELRQLINSLISSVVSLLFNNTNPLQLVAAVGSVEQRAVIDT